jgi:hypothetical protein
MDHILEFANIQIQHIQIKPSSLVKETHCCKVGGAAAISLFVIPNSVGIIQLTKLAMLEPRNFQYLPVVEQHAVGKAGEEPDKTAKVFGGTSAPLAAFSLLLPLP